MIKFGAVTQVMVEKHVSRAQSHPLSQGLGHQQPYSFWTSHIHACSTRNNQIMHVDQIDVRKISTGSPIYASSCMTISGERTEQLDIFCSVTGFMSDFHPLQTSADICVGYDNLAYPGQNFGCHDC